MGGIVYLHLVAHHLLELEVGLRDYCETSAALLLMHVAFAAKTCAVSSSRGSRHLLIMLNMRYNLFFALFSNLRRRLPSSYLPSRASVALFDLIGAFNLSKQEI